MTERVTVGNLRVAPVLYDFVNNEALPGTDIDPDRFEMSVFNRWGEEVFHTTDLDEGWVGQSDDDKLDPGTWYYSMDGVYAYRIVLYSESTNEKREIKGFINLTR